MKTRCEALVIAALVVVGACAQEFTVPVIYYKLPNGLRVVLSRDTTAPTVAVAVHYNVGGRLEPRNRTGFAHLFEHLMFEGSRNLGKMAFIKLVQQNGGRLNGNTRWDYTNYFEVVPSHALETMLWAEADRMNGLEITIEHLRNQQAVVANEMKGAILDQPYRGFPWRDMPRFAYVNPRNSQEIGGSLTDLDAATLDDVRDFFRTYYAPNNAALAIVGDFDPAAARKLIERYFGGIAAVEQRERPDISEPRQTEEKRATLHRPLVKRPGLAWAYHMPERNTPEYYAMGIIDQILLQREDSWLAQELVKSRGYAGAVEGGIGWPFAHILNYKGPMLWIANIIHDPNRSPDEIMQAVDAVVDRLTKQPPEQATIDLAVVKMRSWFYDAMTDLVSRANLLSCFALFDDDPARINHVESHFRKVTPDLVQKTAREYLRSSNRIVLIASPREAKEAR